MKKARQLHAALTGAVFFTVLLSLQSCSTYNQKTVDIKQEMVTGQFAKASAAIDKNKFLGKKRNRLLYLLEKGKMEHLQGNYTESNKLFEEAYILIDDRITTGAAYAVAATFTNPMAAPYKGEDFEKVTIHYYKALNYFFLGQPDEALVEAKRIDIKLQELNNKYRNNKNKYTKDAFSQILQGLLYEGTGDINNAFIAYRNAEEIYTANKGTYFGVTMPQQLKDDLLRTSYSLGFTQEYNDYLKKFGLPTNYRPAQDKASGEAVVFWENGLAPVKDQIVITASGAGMFFYGTYMEDGIVHDILLPIPIGTNLGSINAIAIPKYTKSVSYYGKAALVVGGKEKYFETTQDFYSVAKQCLKDRMLREAVNIAVRFAAKKGGSLLLQEIAKQAMGKDGAELVKFGADAAGAITEKADTRNWQSLPATISYARVPLVPGNNKFLIKKYGPQGVVDTDTINITYKRGLQIVNYFDLGRTQLLPATKPADSLKAANPAPVTSVKMDKKIADKYDKWIDTPDGVSYKVSNYTEVKEGKTYWGKKITFKTSMAFPLKVTYTLTDKPYTPQTKVVSLDEYERLEDEGKSAGTYYQLSDNLKPGVETPGWYPFIQENPDFYVTILKTEKP
jgi:hypothetical protein